LEQPHFVKTIRENRQRSWRKISDRFLIGKRRNNVKTFFVLYLFSRRAISELFLFSTVLTKGAAPFRSQSAHWVLKRLWAKSPRIPPIFAIPRRRLNSYVVLTVTALLALSFAGCASAPKPAGASAPLGKGLGDVPAFVNDAYLNASEDVLIGVGTYKIGKDMSRMGTGKTFAETRARADVSRQLSTIVKNMVNDYTAVSEIDPSAALSFQETITQSLSKSELRGAKAIKIDTDGNGLLWVVIEYSKSAAANEVNQAVNAAKLAVPAAATFNALERMNTAFDKEAGGGPVPVGD
jgi:hypothetical protein